MFCYSLLRASARAETVALLADSLGEFGIELTPEPVMVGF